MSRLEDAEKRLYDAISHLDRALATRFKKEKEHLAAIDILKAKVEQSKTERDDIEKRMKRLPYGSAKRSSAFVTY